MVKSSGDNAYWHVANRVRAEEICVDAGECLMSVTLSASKNVESDPHFVLDGIDWAQYLAISEALPDRPGLRLVYNERRLTFLSPSRRHDWYGERLGNIVISVASIFEIEWEDAVHATYRLQQPNVGVEGDKTFYFGANAELMQGPSNIDLGSQPPPDLAIEVEVTHSADDPIAAWGRLGTPQVWRHNTDNETLRFLARNDDGTYSDAAHSLAFPFLEPADVLTQMQLAAQLGAARWFAQLPEWVRTVLLPRRGR
jgi:Uma2 family endonuclease